MSCMFSWRRFKTPHRNRCDGARANNRCFIESTLKRHGYYCRSRKAGTSTIRARSCTSCARRKAGCDHKWPQCSRCVTKGIECHYPVNTPRDSGSGAPQSSEIPAGREPMRPSLIADTSTIDASQEASNDGNEFVDGTLVLPDLNFADLGGELLGWDEANMEFGDLLENSQTNNHQHSPDPMTLVHHSSPSTDHVAQASHNVPPRFTIPLAPSHAVRSLGQRPKRHAGTQRISNLILHTLKSYPLMMLRHNTLPPFIYPGCVSSVIKDVHLEPLTNCISLVHMMASGVQGSRKLFWKNVGLECERLLEEVR